MARRLTQQEFVNLAKSVHGERYDYSQVEYVNFRTKVTIICSKHGPFLMAPHLHTSNGNNCPGCNTEHRTTPIQTFLARCSKKFDISNLDFSGTVYKGLKHPLTVVCKTHGEFTKTNASELLNSKGCPFCAKRSNGQYKWLGQQDPQLDTLVTVYVVKMTHKESGRVFHKIGVTKHSVNQRFRGYTAYKKEVIHTSSLTLNEALQLEREFSECLTPTTFKFPSHFNGKTECYDLFDDDWKFILAKLPDLKSDVNPC